MLDKELYEKTKADIFWSITESIIELRARSLAFPLGIFLFIPIPAYNLEKCIT